MTRLEKTSIFAFIWHGFFLALTMAMLDLNTVFPSLINVLTTSKYTFGALYSIMLGVPLIFNLIFSHFLQRASHKKRFLLLGIYIRSLSFIGMAIATYYFSEQYPTMVIVSFFFLVFLFSVSGGFAGLSYSDLFAKTISPSRRTSLFTIKQFIGSTSSLLGGFIIARIFNLGITFPTNYTISLAIGGGGLIIASLGFYFIKEPASDIPIERRSLLSYIKNIPSIMKQDRSFRYFIIVENLSSFSIMILPFYILYAKEMIGVDNRFIGTYLIIQIVGTISSNILWGFIGKRFSAKAIVRTCIILGGINPIIALVMGTISPIAYGLVFFIVGFTISGRRIGFEPTLLDIAPPARRIEYLGIRGSLSILVIILPLLGALLINTLGYAAAFITVTIMMMTAAILLSNVSSSEYEDYCN